MKKILLLLLVALSLFSCDKEEVDVPRRQVGRTILAYFWADNDLNSVLRNNIESMVSGLQQMTDSATLVVYWDGKASDKNWSVPTIVKYATNGRGSINNNSKEYIDALLADKKTTIEDYLGLGTIEKTYSSQISTDEGVMRMVITDMLECCRSESYGIVFGSHGSGWLPTITGRSIGVDGSNSNTAMIPELSSALQGALQTVGLGKFDFVLFDACMMGHAEVYYELRNVSRYCIASVLDVPGEGFPYASIIPDLYKKDIQSRLVSICETYVNYYDESWGTVAAVDCSQMEDLAAATKEVLLTYQNNLKKVNTSNLQEYGRKGGTFGNAYDVLHFMESLCEGKAPTTFTEQFNKTVLYASYVPDVTPTYYKIDGDNYCGMGMYIPNSSTSGKYKLWNDYFRNSIAWYQVAGWAETEAIWGK